MGRRSRRQIRQPLRLHFPHRRAQARQPRRVTRTRAVGPTPSAFDTRPAPAPYSGRCPCHPASCRPACRQSAAAADRRCMAARDQARRLPRHRPRKRMRLYSRPISAETRAPLMPIEAWSVHIPVSIRIFGGKQVLCNSLVGCSDPRGKVQREHRGRRPHRVRARVQDEPRGHPSRSGRPRLTAQATHRTGSRARTRRARRCGERRRKTGARSGGGDVQLADPQARADRRQPGRL